MRDELRAVLVSVKACKNSVNVTKSPDSLINVPNGTKLNFKTSLKRGLFQHYWDAQIKMYRHTMELIHKRGIANTERNLIK